MTRPCGAFAALLLFALAPIGAAAGPRIAVAPAAARGPAGPAERLGFDKDRLGRLQAFMSEMTARGKIAGATTLLERHGQLVAFDAYGRSDLASGRPMTREEIFRIYSMSKPITGVAMMILFEEGRWRLDDPVTRFVPEFKDLKVFVSEEKDGRILTVPAKRPPTMREIMSHTAGFGYGLEDKTAVDRLYRSKQVLSAHGLKEMVDRTAEIPLLFQPGTAWSYSSAVDIQGYIVEKLSGEPLGRFLQERLFGPLRMTDTGFFVPKSKAERLASIYAADPKDGRLVEAKDLFTLPMPDYTAPPAMESGGGGLVSTTRDYARFCQMILNKGELDGVRILSPATVELMGANVIPKEVLISSNGTTAARFTEAVGFGLDFAVVSDPRAAGLTVGRNTMSWGGAAGTWFWIDPTNDLFFVGMIQRMGGVPEEDLAGTTRTLVYSALTHPER